MNGAVSVGVEGRHWTLMEETAGETLGEREGPSSPFSAALSLWLSLSLYLALSSCLYMPVICKENFHPYIIGFLKEWAADLQHWDSLQHV